MQSLTSVLRTLDQAGIRTMLLKGAALILAHYEDPGLRPMADLDLLVENDAAAEASEHLGRMGFAPVAARLLPPNRTHSAAFRDKAGRIVDLHWRAMEESLADGDAAFWRESVPMRIGNVSTRVPSPADQLLHTVAHGIKWNAVPPLRWVADGAVILRTAERRLDWSKLFSQAQERRVILPVREGLAYVRDLLDAPVPAQELARFQAERRPMLERLAFRARARAPELRGPLLILGLHAMSYSRLRAAAVIPRGLQGLSVFAKHTWGATRLHQVPLMAGAKGLRRLWQLATWHSVQLLSRRRFRRSSTVSGKRTP